MRLVECVPNFSEGRDRAVLAAIEAGITEVAGIALLDVHADVDHHRSVFTFVGDPAAVLEAAFRATCVAAQRIDLSRHSGEHPRMGAVDVIPFVPLRGVAMQDCIELARSLGSRVGTQLGIPVLLYGHAAVRSDRKELSTIRRGGLRALEARFDARADQPDFGPARAHPTAGAVAVGARGFLVAYNISLDTTDVSVAQRIAGTVRESSGGLPGVQAKGFRVRGKAQVSTNLRAVEVTPLALVYRTVAALARAEGVRRAKGEIVGLAPEHALRGATAEELGIEEPLELFSLERRVRERVKPV